ncbi:MAG TPA: nitroreductase family protein [Candidatus Aminicenantes bacterium]|nr:nitroreductase family protein [Candidatus Aminicenantes bacterium]HRY64815.1 nitroreductase family protein [Candidatus Aminicenantes bacterium]HRZ71728.1 nitroreductase family protein [Candidatus Aminicenantes bacterium]
MDNPVLEVMRRRYSCRSYLKAPLDDRTRDELQSRLASPESGPFGGRVRFLLAAAAAGDEGALKGLGTYGNIRNPQAFIIGAIASGTGDLEDYGYLMEKKVLAAVDLGLATCWLGGGFRQSRFAAKIGAAANESIPAVVSVGHPADGGRPGGLQGFFARRTSRLAADRLFLSPDFGRPLGPGESGPLGPALEAVRWGPSASNKQPWRIVRAGRLWHFYIQRTKGYGQGLLNRIMGTADLQRIDLGIAMCHFELAARELGAAGTWLCADPGLAPPDDLTSYTATWREADSGT